MKRINCALILVLLLTCSTKVYGQPRKTVQYTLDELCVNTQFIHDLDSIIHINWDSGVKWEYVEVWIKKYNEGEYLVSASLTFPPFPPGPHKDHVGYLEYNGLIYIIAPRVNPDNMFVKKNDGRQKTITTKVYEKGQLPPPSDPPEWWLIMDTNKKLREY